VETSICLIINILDDYVLLQYVLFIKKSKIQNTEYISIRGLVKWMANTHDARNYWNRVSNSVQFFIREISYLIVITLKALYLFNKIMLCIHIKNFLQLMIRIFLYRYSREEHKIFFSSDHTGPPQTYKVFLYKEVLPRP